jgi:hypothetical protein
MGQRVSWAILFQARTTPLPEDVTKRLAEVRGASVRQDSPTLWVVSDRHVDNLRVEQDAEPHVAVESREIAEHFAKERTCQADVAS